MSNPFSPYEIIFLLKLSSSRLKEENEMAFEATLDKFVRLGLTQGIGGNDDRFYPFELSPCGKAYIEGILALPLPKIKWVFPDNQ